MGNRKAQRRPKIEELEPRILYSADVSPLVASPPPVEQRTLDVGGEFIASAGTTQPATETSRHEIVFVDTNTPDYEKLVDDIQSQSSAERRIEVVLLDAQGDGIKQISSVLSGAAELSAVHLISHGADGEVQLGANTLNFDSLLKNAAQIKGWGQSFANGADLLIYGCDVAQTADGKALVDALSRLTGADVAASENLTGAAAQGADWNLEYHEGAIQTQLAVSYATQLNWNYVLNTYTVTTTADSGAGSLRAAITSANTNGGADTIDFNIAGGGVKTINLASALPSIDEAVLLDGWSQGGVGYTGAPLIELNGAGTAASTPGLLIDSANSTVRGFVINRFGGAAIEINGIGSSGNVIQGNYLGTNAAGTAASANTTGVMIRNGATGNTVGGTAVGTGNVVSGNTGDGIDIWDSGTSNNVVLGNLIGLNAAGTADVANQGSGIGLYAGIDNTIGGTVAGAGNVVSGNWFDGIGISADGTVVQGNFIGVTASGSTALDNGGDGIAIDTASGITIGGTTAGARNVISGNSAAGIDITDASSTGIVIMGNLIGVGADGSTAVGNGTAGINILNSAANNMIGGTIAGAGNTIANNTGDGVRLATTAGSGNAILGNSIYNNTTNGIDLENDGLTANDVNDVDNGTNGLQNFPVLTIAVTDGAHLTVAGTFNSVASKTYRLEFFSNTAADASGNGEGQTYLGFVSVTTDGSGNATFNTTLNAVVAAGAVISATATDPTNNTSEFAANLAASSSTLVVDTANDVSDGNTTSIAALLAGKGVDGKISLREAITAANNTLDGAGGIVDLIKFAIAGGGVRTITLASALPTISDSIFIDGWSQGGVGYTGTPLIELNGAGAGATVNGLVVSASDSTIRGLVINRFTAHGIRLSGDNNTVVGSYLGTDGTGTIDRGNARNGIEITGSNNTIGGITASERNVLSGNTESGIWIHGLFGAPAAGNIVQGNYIGTNAAGTAALGNTLSGIVITDPTASGNRIGGTVAGSGNVISGNADSGIAIGYATGGGNLFQGNFIGTNAAGTAGIANTRGIQITDDNNNTVGGSAAGAANLIAYNTGDGVEVLGTSSGNVISANSIYSNGNLSIDLANDGVTNNDGGDADTGPNARQNFPVLSAAVTNGTQAFIGGTLNSTASRSFRVEFFASPSGLADPSGHGEAQRYLGSVTVTTNGSGNATISSLLTAVVTAGEIVTASATDLTTNNTSELSTNVTASTNTLVVDTANDVSDGNTASIGALLGAKGADGKISLREAITAANNTQDGAAGMVDLIKFAIGGAGVKTITLASALPTIDDAIFLDGWSQGGIGYNASPLIEINNNGFSGLLLTAGDSTVRGFIIGGSSNDGLKVTGGGNNLIVGNWFGLNPAGTGAAANADDGFQIDDSDNNTVGGLNSYERNVFSGNGDDGIEIKGDNNLIIGNRIGLNAAGNAAIANGDDGFVFSNQAVNNTLGGTTAAAANVISGNTDDGVVVLNLGTTGNVIIGNIIGRDPTNTATIANGNDGIQISSQATGDTIGGTTAGAGNIISGNTGRGINVAFDASDNPILGNSIYGNGGLGIDLNGNGVTANDGAGDADGGGNQNQNFPVLTSATSNVGTISIVGSLTGAAGSTFRVEFFASTAGDATHGEGERYLGFIDVTTDGAGVGAFTANLSGALTPGQLVISATATDAIGNTSEFAANITGTILGPNTAPVLSGANDLTAIREDLTNAANVGTLVSALISGQVTDADGGVLTGIAVMGVVNTNGTWQYSTNSGGSWTAFGSPGATTARLLAANASTYVRFVPSGDYNGTVSNGITFRAWDQTSGTAGGTADVSTNGGTTAFSAATASASVTVTSVNDGPAGINKTVTTLEDTPYTFTVADFGFTDPDDQPANALMAVKISALPGAGSLTLAGIAVTAGQTISAASITAGDLQFTPAANGNGAGYTSFTFQVQDDGGTASFGVDTDASPNTITVNVTPVNDIPAGTNNTITANEDTQYTFAAADFGFTDASDSPANALMSVVINTIAGAGSLTLSGVAVIAGQTISVANIAAGNLKFTPAGGASGTGYASFTFQVQDDGGTANGAVDLDASPNTMTIDVASRNDAPAGTNNTVTTNEDTAYTFAAADFGFSDASDTPANNLSAIRIAIVPGAGSLTLSGVAVAPGQSISVANIVAGNLRFTPSANANGAGYASFTFQVRDDGGTANGGVDLDPVARTLTIDVTAVNDAPVIAQNTLTLSGGSSVTLSATQLSASDVDNPAAGLLFSISAISHGRFELSSAPGVAIVGFSQAQITGGLVRFVHDASSIAPGYSVSVSDGTLSAGPAAASVNFSVNPGPGAPGPVLPPSGPGVPGAPPPSTPPAPQPAPVPDPTAGGDSGSGLGGSDGSGAGHGGDGSAGAGGGAGQGGAQGSAASSMIGVLDASAGRSARAEIPRLPKFAEIKSIAAVTEVQSLPPVEVGMFIQSEAQYPKFEGTARADWSITSAYRDDSSLRMQQKEQFTVIMDSAEMGGIALSVGVVWWASRITGVIGSLLASMPAWRQLDPMPVVGRDDEEEDWNEQDNEAYADELAISMMLEGPQDASMAMA